MALEPYPFRYRDPLTRKWVSARCVAELAVIAEQYTEWEITGPHEIRSGDATMFSPFRRPAAHLPPVEDPPPDHGPTPDPPPVEQPPPIDNPLERFLVLVFLHRYIIYCARLRRFGQMMGARSGDPRIASVLSATKLD